VGVHVLKWLKGVSFSLPRWKDALAPMRHGNKGLWAGVDAHRGGKDEGYQRGSEALPRRNGVV
jgi:hypothetical protein